MDRFLIPANSKKSMLIFGLFNSVDLIYLVIGVGTSLILLPIVGPTETVETFIVLIPALVTALLLWPVSNYHNVRTAIKSIWEFFMNRQVFIWKGWCAKDEYSETTTKK